MDIIKHTKDLLMGGDGYHCWLSSNKKHDLVRYQHIPNCCTAAAAAATSHKPQSIVAICNPLQGHTSLGLSSVMQSAASHQQGHRTVQGLLVSAAAGTAVQLPITVQPPRSPKRSTQLTSSQLSGCPASRRGPLCADVASDSRLAASAILQCTGRRTATECCAAEINISPDIQPLPTGPDGKAVLISR